MVAHFVARFVAHSPAWILAQSALSVKTPTTAFLLWQRLSVLTGQHVLRTASKQEKQEGGEPYASL